MLLQFVLSVLLAYFLGAIPSGIIIARVLARKDVRVTGSGHTGALNTLRTVGKVAGVFTFLADAGKAIVAIELARALTNGDAWVAAFAGIAAIGGHCYPLYTRGRGGMGLAPAIGALLVFAPGALVVQIALWFVLRFALEHSARASMGIALTLAFGVGAGAVIFARHRFDNQSARV